MAISKILKGIKTLSKAEKKIKAPKPKGIKEGSAEFKAIYAKKFKEAKDKGQKRISINNILKKSPDGKGHQDTPKKAFYMVTRGKAKKKDLTGLRKFIYNLDTAALEAVMDVISRNDSKAFMKMYPRSKGGEYMSSIAYAHRND